jgi:Ca-activated chloride channel family protein
MKLFAHTTVFVLAAALAGPVAHADDVDIELEVEVGEPVMISGADGTAYIKISLVGFELVADGAERAPVNLAVVIDRSSSMTGPKFEQAKQAAMMVVDRLGVDDVVSIVTYDTTVEVLVAATKLGGKRESIKERIWALRPRGSTALFGGVSHGMEEIGKFLSDGRVNRIILLSDGLANIGPSSPDALGRLGDAAGSQGIAVTTLGIGLGYNEDLMTRLAVRSDGNHAFVEDVEQLATFFTYELGDVMSVVAQDIEIEVEFGDGVRPIRSLNRAAQIHGRKAHLSFNQLVAKQQRYVILEARVPATAAGAQRPVATVNVAYDHMLTKKRRRLAQRAQVVFSPSVKRVRTAENRDVMITVAELQGLERSQRAIALRDQGRADEAEVILRANAHTLEDQSKRYRSPKLRQSAEAQRQRAISVGKKGQEWNQSRKSMIKEDYSFENNTTY